MLSTNQLQKLFPNANKEHILNFAEKHEELFNKYNIQDWQIPMFLAQIGHESGGLSRMVENLNYSAKGLMRVWRRRFPSYSIANAYARNPEKIANKVYSNRMGNGPESSGDGWRYRGHGYIQLTGKDAYIKVGNIIGIDLVSDPKLPVNPEYALEVVCGVWVWKRLTSVNNFITMTKRINGGLNGLSDRKHWLSKAKRQINTPSNNKSSIFITKDLIYKIQKELKLRGYTEVGLADGIVGNKTRAGIKNFKIDNKIGSDYNINRALLDSLRIVA
jgi:putative chitinase